MWKGAAMACCRLSLEKTVKQIHEPLCSVTLAVFKIRYVTKAGKLPYRSAKYFHMENGSVA
jgi:hypothetical protein